MPRSSWTPTDPRKAHQCAFSVLASGPVEIIADANNGAVSSFRKYGFPCGLCGSLCTLQSYRSAFASFTTATLGTNGWLGLVRQGLSPCKERQALLGAPPAYVTRWWAGVDSAWEQIKPEARKMLEKAAKSSAPSAYHPGARAGRFVRRDLDFLLIPPLRHLLLEEFAFHLVHQQYMLI